MASEKINGREVLARVRLPDRAGHKAGLTVIVAFDARDEAAPYVAAWHVEGETSWGSGSYHKSFAGAWRVLTYRVSRYRDLRTPGGPTQPSAPVYR